MFRYNVILLPKNSVQTVRNFCREMQLLSTKLKIPHIHNVSVEVLKLLLEFFSSVAKV